MKGLGLPTVPLLGWGLGGEGCIGLLLCCWPVGKDEEVQGVLEMHEALATPGSLSKGGPGESQPASPQSIAPRLLRPQVD